MESSLAEMSMKLIRRLVYVVEEEQGMLEHDALKRLDGY